MTLLLALCALACPGDLQEESPYAKWKNGPSAKKDFFPLAVWLQAPRNAAKYKAIGINTYMGLWKGPTEEQLRVLRQEGMRVICSQNKFGLTQREDPIIMAWMHGDEPDNAQKKTGGGWGPAIPTQRIIEDYRAMRQRDPTRPVFLNLGQGVANDEWVGRGCKMSDYPEYVKGCDIVSFDVYPVVGIRKPDGENYLWYVGKGVDRLRQWTDDKKIVWNVVECTRIGNPDKKATPKQVRSEVWMSIVRGSRGIVYFCHQFKPKFIEAALLADKEMSEAVGALNRQILSLAPVLNSPTVQRRATVRSSDDTVPISLLVKEYEGAIHLFAVGMRNAPTRGAFRVTGLKGRTDAEVIGENRTIPVKDGRFEEAFEPYGVLLLRIKPAK